MNVILVSSCSYDEVQNLDMLINFIPMMYDENATANFFFFFFFKEHYVKLKPHRSISTLTSKGVPR